MMGLERVAVLLMCACVITSTTTDVVVDFDEFISDWSLVDIVDSTQHNSDRYLEDRLYESVCYNNYDKAVQQSKDIIKRGRNHNIIKTTVDFLIEHNKYQATPFAYKLWEANGHAVIEKLFPDEFQMVFNDSLVTLTHYRHNLPIKLRRRDDLQDKEVLANDGNGTNYTWKLEPAYFDGNIYFKIRNIVDGRYLTLAENTDRDGYHLAYGSLDSNTERHLWMLQPTRHDGVILFFLVNRKYYQGLRLAEEVSGGDRRVFSAEGDVVDHPEQYGWRVQAIKDERTKTL